MGNHKLLLVLHGRQRSNPQPQGFARSSPNYSIRNTLLFNWDIRPPHFFVHLDLK